MRKTYLTKKLKNGVAYHSKPNNRPALTVAVRSVRVSLARSLLSSGVCLSVRHVGVLHRNG